MKKIAFILLACGFSFLNLAQSHADENGKTVPSVKLKNLSGETINTEEIGKDKLIVVSFWATWCSPCKRELNTIADLYTDWQDETDVTLYAVTIDNQQTKGRVEPYVNGKAWDYEILYDPNGDFKRAMGVNNVPHTFIIKNGKIVYSHNNYVPGDEETLYETLLELSK